MFKKLKIAQISLLFLFFCFAFQDKDNMGCGGCYKVIDKEYDNREINGLRVNVRAKKLRDVQYITPKGGRLNFEIGRKKKFKVKYAVKIENRLPIEDLCLRNADKKTPLDKYLDEFSIEISKNNKHLAVGILDKPESFHHLIIDGVSFSSGKYYFYKSNTNAKDLTFDAIDWNIFPNPEELLDSLLIENKNSVNTEYGSHLLSVLSDLSPGNEHDFFLIKNWPTKLAEKHFSKYRVRQILNGSPEWKKTALEKSLSIIESDKVYYSGFNASVNLISYIRDAATLYHIDSLLVFEKNDRSYSDYYFHDRFFDEEIPMQKAARLELIKQAEKLLIDYPKSKSFINTKFAIEILNHENEKKVLEQFINKLISNKGLIEFKYSVLQLTIDEYSLYSKEMQALILERYVDVMENPSEDINIKNLLDIYRFIQYKIPCEQLIPIYDKNKERLTSIKLPPKCKGE